MRPANDSAIERSGRSWLPLGVAAAVILVAGSFWWFGAPSPGRSVSLARADVDIDAVDRGPFENIATVRASAIPSRTVFLDAVEGGVVSKLFVEDGATVVRNQPLLEFQNTALKISVSSASAQIGEQLNELRNTENMLRVQQFNTDKEIIDIDHRISELTRALSLRTPLFERSLISEDYIKTTTEELDHEKALRRNAVERRRVEDEFRTSRLRQIQAQSKDLESNLASLQASLESLVVLAPIDGLLSSFDIKLGESRQRGERLGRIDSVEDFLVRAQIDEFYLPKVAVGQTARFHQDSGEYRLRLTKIYPVVTNGQFSADFAFDDGNQRPFLSNGQSMTLDVELAAAERALRVKNGRFLADSGGNWAFVLQGDSAIRRPIKVGRRNQYFVEILEGLDVGDRIITSSYSTFADATTVELKD